MFRDKYRWALYEGGAVRMSTHMSAPMSAHMFAPMSAHMYIKGAEMFSGRRTFFTSSLCVHLEVMHPNSRETALYYFFIIYYH